MRLLWIFTSQLPKPCFLYRGKVFSRDNVTGEGSPLDPQPFLVRASYVSSEEELQKTWSAILTALRNSQPKQILHLALSPDGPPYRAARLFTFKGKEHFTANGGRSSLTVDGLYPAEETGMPWDGEFQRLNPGLFITGDGGPKNVWRIHRVERDPWGGPLFTLAPVYSLRDSRC